MFEPFQPDGRHRSVAFEVRDAGFEDAQAMGALLAAREGGTVAGRAEGFRGELERIADGTTRKRILVAEHVASVLAYARLTWLPTSQIEGATNLPEGWYLLGVIVRPDVRRSGIGRALVRARLQLAAREGNEVFYWTNVRNRTSIALHAEFGFREVRRDFTFPNLRFEGGEGILFRCPLDEPLQI